jgi:hypothetical protein
VVKASLVGALLLLSAIGPVLVWIMEDRRVQIFLWHSLPIVFAVLVALKMTGVTLVAVRLARSTVLSQRTLIRGAATWTIAVLTLYGVLVWWFSTPHVPRYVLMLVAILLVPLARVSAAPLALAWNRHR